LGNFVYLFFGDSSVNLTKNFPLGGGGGENFQKKGKVKENENLN
jgi:hypothetical protein